MRIRLVTREIPEVLMTGLLIKEIRVEVEVVLNYRSPGGIGIRSLIRKINPAKVVG